MLSLMYGFSNHQICEFSGREWYVTEINKFYGEDVPLDQAWERYIGALQSSGLWESPIGEEVIPLNEQGVGRVPG